MSSCKKHQSVKHVLTKQWFQHNGGGGQRDYREHVSFQKEGKKRIQCLCLGTVNLAKFAERSEL